ncbi:uncharacterized protein LOC126898673 [Daktulosphaira vitifoliae]|uniref:uncharacterized protein LOC126898673 n=1 Tax=Daktulosphaira vitifoliae TaxID=58002 RepID=UPI0021AA4DE6|nr:uncharacterized protein LOC126898673 [Daktulosphaira vitifoliae]XP_050528915.1 uncharacterized protein LOC126898673 [Daktulosphaira vitifoliae]
MMLLSRLIFFFMLICLTSSIFSCRKMKQEREPEQVPELKREPIVNPDEVTAFNNIINSIGWNNIIGFEFKAFNGDSVPIREWVHAYSSINNVPKTHFKTISKPCASMVLRKIYSDMLHPLRDYYSSLSLVYKYRDEESKLTNLKILIEMFSTFKPLMSCMANALNYFECTNEDFVFDVLNKSLLLTDELTTINNFYNSDNTLNYEFINSTLEKIYVFATKYGYLRLKYIYELRVEPFLQNYITELKKLQYNYSYNNHIDPNLNLHVKNGVFLLCRNFGF